MSNITRARIYDSYKEILEEIINRQKFREYAESEIDALIREISATFEIIKKESLRKKAWDDFS